MDKAKDLKIGDVVRLSETWALPWLARNNAVDKFTQEPFVVVMVEPDGCVVVKHCGNGKILKVKGDSDMPAELWGMGCFELADPFTTAAAKAILEGQK